MPEELRGLRIADCGDLVDERGNVVNEFGATRFDIAVRYGALRTQTIAHSQSAGLGGLSHLAQSVDRRAMRGEFGGGGAEDTEAHSEGKILGALVNTWPAPYSFQFVGSDPDGTLTRDVCNAVGEVLEQTVLPAEVEAKPRLGGKYLSICITTRVRAPELVGQVFRRLEGDPRIRMKF